MREAPLKCQILQAGAANIIVNDAFVTEVTCPLDANHRLKNRAHASVSNSENRDLLHHV